MRASRYASTGDSPETATQVDRRRSHTGRRRNEAARQAILDAALLLLSRADGNPVSVETIAREAGVGKQTIYRWWPSKGAVILEALTERARDVVPAPDTGSLLGDLEAFLISTFRAVQRDSTSSVLRTVMAEAQRDAHLTKVLQEFTGRRRAALREIAARGRNRGELPPDADLDLLVELAYGLLWYRVLIGHAPLTDQLASQLAHTLVAAAHPRPRP